MAAPADNDALLYVDRYRPGRLSDLKLHGGLTARLQHLAARPAALPHLLFYGPAGAGKHTRVAALLRELYGAAAERVRVDHRTATLGKVAGGSAGVAVDLVTVSSAHHIELNPSDYGQRDKLVVQEVIKEIAQSRPLDTIGGQQQQKELEAAAAAGAGAGAGEDEVMADAGASATSAKGHFKVVVINEADALTRDAQHALRRTMEKYMASCRLILCATSACGVTDPIRSRCLAIRVPAPDEEQITDVLQNVARREKFTLPDPLAARLASASGRNLRKALLALEATRARALATAAGGALADDTPVVRADWEEYITAIAEDIVREQTPAALVRVRDRLYELLSHCIPAPLILRTLALDLVSRSSRGGNNDLAVAIVRWAAEYEHRLHLGTKDIFHLEAFVARIMALQRRMAAAALSQ